MHLPSLNDFNSVTTLQLSLYNTHFNNIFPPATLHCPILTNTVHNNITCYVLQHLHLHTPAATCVLRREPRRGPPPVGTITSLSRFITCHARAQERRKCARDLCRCASATRNIDLVQIQRLLVQTDEDLREASLGPPGNKCGIITHGQLQRSVTSRLQRKKATTPHSLSSVTNVS